MSEQKQYWRNECDVFGGTNCVGTENCLGVHHPDRDPFLALVMTCIDRRRAIQENAVEMGFSLDDEK